MIGRLRNIQLIIMGIVAIIIGPVVAGVTTLVHGLPFPMSISETGTIANQSAPLLPFFLGMLAIFALGYSLTYAYSKIDSVFTGLMFVGFGVVALQMCASVYITQETVGAFGLSPSMSAIFHNVGAFVGFGALICWVMLCFTKSDKPKNERTKEKRLRNVLYWGFGITGTICLALLILSNLGIIKSNFPMVFVLEIVVLTFCGIACLVKGEVALKDKK